jgi:hypothetical protein
VAAEPLVSVPFSPSACSAEIAPPLLALSATVKYVAPSSLGTTNTFSPVFSDPELELLDDDPPLDAALDDELLDEPHAARPTTVDRTASAAATPDVRLASRLRGREPSSTSCMEHPLLS